MAMAITICRFCMVVLLVAMPGRCAPRSKGGRGSSAPKTVYDQKQTGEYNVQLHLKDFQVIALLGDDYFGGDYDYSYDYSDFTLKPSTQKPTTGVTPSPQPEPSTSPAPEKPSSTSSPTTSPSDPTPPPKGDKQEEPSSTSGEDKPTKPEVEETPPTNVTVEVVEIVESSTPSQKDKYEETNSPGKIKVQIIETPVGIVPGEVSEKEGAVHHGEMVQLRRCAQGYTRDKKGRCRRFRRPGSVSPQLPYGISRIANNLASRFRYTSSEESVPSSESTED